jgi:hypothetical protein
MNTVGINIQLLYYWKGETPKEGRKFSEFITVPDVAILCNSLVK